MGGSAAPHEPRQLVAGGRGAGARETAPYKRWRELSPCLGLVCQPLPCRWPVPVASLPRTMVRTKADGVPASCRKVVASRAPRKVLGSSSAATNSMSSSSPSSRKGENKYAGGNPVCVRPTPKWQKGIGEFFSLCPRDSEKENWVPEEAGSSGLGKAKKKACPLQPDTTDDEKE